MSLRQWLTTLLSPRRPARSSPARLIERRGYRIEVDLDAQRLMLDLPPTRGVRAEPKLTATPSVGSGVFVTAAMLAMKAKQFDDGLVAAVELAASRGIGKFVGVGAWLAGMLDGCSRQSPDDGVPHDVLLAAAHLGGDPRRISRAARTRLAAFERDPMASKPLSLYTWNDELRAIYRRDRMLQQPLDGARHASVLDLARSLRARPELRSAYEHHLTLRERLSGTLAGPDLRPILTALDRDATRATVPANLSLMPPSAGPEGRLLEQLLPDMRRIPRGFDLTATLIERVRAGTVSLAPTEHSGFYDYQLWALAALLEPERTPEGRKLRFGREYAQSLTDLFSSLMALSRESQLKNLGGARKGAVVTRRPPVRFAVAPALRVEPLAEFYLRRAASYRFLREQLEQALGRQTLGAMRGLTADGPRPQPLAIELARIESLFYGAYAVACDDLGLAPSVSPAVGSGSVADDTAVFQRFARGLRRDRDIARDARMMVPLFYDAGRRLYKVHVMLGWTVRPLTIRYSAPDAIRVFDSAGRDVTSRVQVGLGAQRVELACPATAEIYVRRLRDRDAMRRLCGTGRTRAQILATLARS